MSTSVFNRAMVSWCAPRAARFQRALMNPDVEQRHALERVLKITQGTTWNDVISGYDAIRSIDEFRSRVPLSTYEDVRARVVDVARGHPRILTNEKVIRLEETSGSTASSKQIPYTRALLTDLYRAYYPWTHGLFTTTPALLSTKAFWSVSGLARRPADKNDEETRRVPVGIDDDTDYFPGLGALVLNRILVVPAFVSRLHNPETALSVVLLYLLASPDVGWFSIFSPTFLLALLERFDRHRSDILSTLRTGDLASLGTNKADTQILHAQRLPSARAHASRILETSNQIDAATVETLWPRLRVISMWADGPARFFAHEVRKLFPGVRIDNKGLLSTEGVVSVPLPGASAPVVALRSHFFEFLPQTDSNAASGSTKLVHELEEGREYEVVLSQRGGFLRYRTNDVVRVEGFFSRTPMVLFVGRKGGVVDVAGEKLSPFDVERAVERLLPSASRPLFLVADRAARRYIAVFATRGHGVVDDVDESVRASQSARALDEILLEHFHYRRARDLGQLLGVDAVLIERPLLLYQYEMSRRGVKTGDQKPSALLDDDVLANVLRSLKK